VAAARVVSAACYRSPVRRTCRKSCYLAPVRHRRRRRSTWRLSLGGGPPPGPKLRHSRRRKPHPASPVCHRQGRSSRRRWEWAVAGLQPPAPLPVLFLPAWLHNHRKKQPRRAVANHSLGIRAWLSSTWIRNLQSAICNLESTPSVYPLTNPARWSQPNRSGPHATDSSHHRNILLFTCCQGKVRHLLKSTMGAKNCQHVKWVRSRR
jgi:hypothetical protein